MRRKTLSLLILSTFGLLLIGCNRGCTTSHTIASESKAVKTNGGNAEIIGRVIDYRHSRRVGRNVFNRSVSHSYGLSFDVRFGTFEEREFFHEGVKDPEAVNLTKELKRVKVAISRDQSHIGLGVDGKVVELIHLYKSNRISTADKDLLADGTMNWSDLDIESFPPPSKILIKGLKENCGQLSYGSNAVIEFCNASKPSAEVHRVMLDQWPSCSFTKDYYTGMKVRELSKSKKWRKYAEKRGKQILENIERIGFDLDEVVNFIDALDSPKLNEKLDEALFEKWGKKGITDFTDVLVERIENNKSAMNKEIRVKIYNDAKSNFMEFQKTGESDRSREALHCFRILRAFGDTTVGYNFVQSSFGTNVARYNTYDFLEVAYDDLGLYTDYQQQLIIQKTEETFENCNKHARSSYFLDIEDLVDCSMLKRLKKKYPEDLKFREVPQRCRPQRN